MATTSRIRDEAQTAAILGAVSVQPATRLWSLSGGTYRLEDLDLERERLAIRRLSGPTQPDRLSLRLYRSLFEIGSQSWRDRGDVVELNGVHVFSTNARAQPRLEARIKAEVTLRAYGRNRRGSLQNLNFHSLGVVVDDGPGQWKVGALLTATVKAGGTTVRGAARVCRVIPAERGAYLALEFSPDMDRTSLLELILQFRFPNLAKRAATDDGDVCQLMEQTGYAKLRRGKPIDSRWLSLDEPNVSVDRVHLAPDGKLLGHVSLTRGYRNCWVAHQLATRRHHRDLFDARLDFYRLGGFVVPLLMDGEDAAWIAYYDRNLSWHRQFFEGFVRWMGDENHSLITNWDRFEEVSQGSLRLIDRPRWVELSMATDNELAAAAKIVAANLPALTARCLDVTEGGLRAANLHGEYANSRYTRSREVAVLRLHGRVVGTALLERGTGLSIFGLFDHGQLFFDPEAEIPSAAKLELMEFVRSWYRDRGVHGPMITAPEGTFPVVVHDKLKLEETMGQIALSATAMRHYENFIEFTTPWARDERVRRREERRKC